MTFRSWATTQCYQMRFFFSCDFSTMCIGHRFPRERSFQTFFIGRYLSSFPILVGVSKFCIISEFKDWFESESRAPGALITSGMSPFSVYSQISDERFKGPTQPGSIAMAEGAKQLG